MGAPKQVVLARESPAARLAVLRTHGKAVHCPAGSRQLSSYICAPLGPLCGMGAVRVACSCRSSSSTRCCRRAKAAWQAARSPTSRVGRGGAARLHVSHPWISHRLQSPAGGWQAHRD